MNASPFHCVSVCWYDFNAYSLQLGILCQCACLCIYGQSKKKQNISLSAGFEPAREDPNGFLVHRLNHSATTTVPVIGWMPKYFMCLSVYLFQKVKKYILRFNWGSNPGPLACEASVITTTPLNRCTQAIPVLKLYTCKHDINNKVKKLYFVPTLDNMSCLSGPTITCSTHLFYVYNVCKAKRNDGQYGARTHDIRVISTTL